MKWLNPCLLAAVVGLGFSPALWAEAYLVKNINTLWSSGPWSLIEANGITFFNANDSTGEELWKSDGTPQGTVKVKEISPYQETFTWYLTAVNGVVFFGAEDGLHGWELWRSDGTAEGTVMVKDIRPGEDTSAPQALANIDGLLLFSATGPSGGQELWRSDGTDSGTFMVKDINPKGDSGPYQITNVKGTAFFLANDGTHGTELWKSDGTTTGTVLVKDIYPTDRPRIGSLTAVNDTLFLVTDDGTHGRELWKSDGTTAGTVMVKDINPFNEGKPWYLTNLNGTLFFTANDGSNGIELWKSDGTAIGTMMVKDLNPGPSSADPWYLTVHNGNVFFSANDGTHQRELWKSDGTAMGTVMVKDINQTTNRGSQSYTAYFTSLNDLLFFRAEDGIHGAEVWQTDGTEAGTLMVADINTNPKITMGSAYPEHFAAVNGSIFFSAIDNTHGRELWAIRPALEFYLSNSVLEENQPVGMMVAKFTPARPGEEYTLVAGDGDKDNQAFLIGGNTLSSKAVFNYKQQRLYQIRVQFSDGQTHTLTKRFLLTVKTPPLPPIILPPPPTVREVKLTVALAGNGTGKLTSTPVGIDCGTQCTYSFLSGKNITLTATPASDSVFKGWSGSCQGNANQLVVVMMETAISCTATFELLPPPPPLPSPMTLTVKVTGPGIGSIVSTPAGIDCGTHCLQTFNQNQTVTLTAMGYRGTVFAGWSGDCQGTQFESSVVLDRNRTCVARFELLSIPPMDGLPSL